MPCQDDHVDSYILMQQSTSLETMTFNIETTRQEIKKDYRINHTNNYILFLNNMNVGENGHF